MCARGLELSCRDALTLRLCEVVRRARFRGALTGSAQDLLDQRWAEPSQAGPTQAWGGGAVVSQMIDVEQLFSRETGLEEYKDRDTNVQIQFSRRDEKVTNISRFDKYVCVHCNKFKQRRQRYSFHS